MSEAEDRRQPWVDGMPPIKVWRVNDYEWWAGATLEEIRAEYERQTGIHPDNIDEGGFENPREVDDAGMQRLQFRRDDEDTFKDDPNLPWSFAQELAETIKAGTKFPCPFAGTEF